MKRILTISMVLSMIGSFSAQPEINCDTVYAEPAESEYILPFGPEKTYTVTQSNCHPTGGHFLTFAYDFNTLMGDTIVACRSGIVVFANDQYADTDWTSGHENNVFIEHPDGTRIRYTHLMQGGVLVSQNQMVEQGQPIGLSGNSGNTGGFPHLHLSAFQDGSSYNRQNTIPINFCNTNDPVNDQNLLIEGQSYTAFDKNITAIEQAEKEGFIKVFPNPVRNFLNVKIVTPDYSPNQIQLVNTDGKLVFSSNIGHESREIKISVSELPKGLYFLVFKCSNETIWKKVLIL